MSSDRRPIGGIENPEKLPSWALGPFSVDDTRYMEPSQVGWDSGRILNTSLIEENNKLVAFYRGTPDERFDQDSRIGLAWGVTDDEFKRYSGNPILKPDESPEQRGYEDPKIYEYDGTYYLYYNIVWESTGLWSDPEKLDPRIPLESSALPNELRCNICLATSKDLIHWTEHGQIVPLSLSGGWAKGAVIPHDPSGQPVKINNEFLMFVGELDKDYQLIGRSDDLIHWDFERTEFITPMPEHGVRNIKEPATMITDIPGRGDDMILTFNYSPSENLKESLHMTNSEGDEYPPSGQALYSKQNPTEPIDFAPEPAGSWGGIIEYNGEWLFPEQESTRFARAQLE